MKSTKNKTEKNTGLSDAEYLIILLPIIIVIGILSIFVKCGTNKDHYDRYLINTCYKGKVVNKFINDKAHGQRTLTLIDHNEQFNIDTGDWIYLWDLSSIGDSIVKNKGNLQLLLIRHNNTDTMLINYEQNRDGITFMKRFE